MCPFFIAFKKFWFVQIPVIGKSFVVIDLLFGIYYNPEQVVVWFHELILLTQLALLIYLD